jgi:hypothetical protein
MDGNDLQNGTVLAGMIDAAIARFDAIRPPQPKESTVPAPLKWAGGIAAAVFTAGIAAFFLWLTSTVNDMQVTLARMDERMAGQAGDRDARFADIDRRVTRLEAYHAGTRGSNQ